MSGTMTATRPARRRRRLRVWPWRVAVQAACLAALPLLGNAPPLVSGLVGGCLLAGTVLFGRFFCGWACSAGTLFDGIRWLFAKTVLRRFPRLRFTVPKKTHRVLIAVKYVLLAGMIVAMLLSGSGLGGAEQVAGSSDPVAVAATMVVSVVFLVATGLVPRFFCRYLCPLGAAQAVLALPRRARIVKSRGGCGPHCRLCTAGCPMQIDLNAVDQVRNPECVQCLRCVDACPPRGTARLALTTPEGTGQRNASNQLRVVT